jgi:hypothetical protein
MDDQLDAVVSRPSRSVSYFYVTENLDTSTQVETSKLLGSVYTDHINREALNLMSAFRKDLFVSVTLPLLGLGVVVLGILCASFAFTWNSYARLDDAIGPLETATTALAANSIQTKAVLDELKLLQKEARDNREADRQQAKFDYEQLNALLQELKQGQAVTNEVLKKIR